MLERSRRDPPRKRHAQVHREPRPAHTEHARGHAKPHRDPAPEHPGSRLDAIARALFDHDEGRARLAPQLSRFDATVGPILDDDDDREVLLAIRLDWALCDAPLEGDPHDTWLARVLDGRVPGLAPHDDWAELRALHAGLFEVWPGRGGTFLRDLVHGLSLPLDERFDFEPAAGSHGTEPAALWDVRLWLGPGGVQLVRPPLAYPLAVLPIVRDAMARRFRPGHRPLDLLRLRRAWLEWQRRPRLPPTTLFARAFD